MGNNYLNLTQTFNGHDYEVTAMVYKSEISLTYPQKIKNVGNFDNDYKVLIPSEEIRYFCFKNSIINTIPELILEINDNEFALTWLLKGQNLRLYFKIKTQNDDIIENEWIIKNYETIENTAQSIVYKVYCELDCAIPLNTICEYATSYELEDPNGADGFEKAHEIAFKILQEYNFKYYVTESKSNPRFAIPNSHYVKFISYQNMTVLNAVKYLLSVGCRII